MYQRRGLISSWFLAKSSKLDAYIHVNPSFNVSESKTPISHAMTDCMNNVGTSL